MLNQYMAQVPYLGLGPCLRSVALPRGVLNVNDMVIHNPMTSEWAGVLSLHSCHFSHPLRLKGAGKRVAPLAT